MAKKRGTTHLKRQFFFQLNRDSFCHGSCLAFAIPPLTKRNQQSYILLWMPSASNLFINYFFEIIDNVLFSSPDRIGQQAKWILGFGANFMQIIFQATHFVRISNFKPLSLAITSILSTWKNTFPFDFWALANFPHNLMLIIRQITMTKRIAKSSWIQRTIKPFHFYNCLMCIHQAL